MDLIFLIFISHHFHSLFTLPSTYFRTERNISKSVRRGDSSFKLKKEKV